MANVTRQHPNSTLTPAGRHRMVLVVIDAHWSIDATADKFQVDAKTVRKWRDRYLTEGVAGLQDRSSRPHRSPTRTQARLRKRVLHLRRSRRWGADRIAHHTRLAPSTVQGILNAPGAGGLTQVTGRHGSRSSVISVNDLVS